MVSEYQSGNAQEKSLEFLYEYGLFLAKAVTFVIAVFAIVAVIASTAIKQKHKNT